VRDAVLAVERAYVEVGAGRRPGPAPGRTPSPRALAAAGAVASHHLAVSMPRSFALVGEGPVALLSLEAHRTWFAPRDVRCTSPAVAAEVGGRAVSLDEALAADLVCIAAPLALAPEKLRRGTHVNALASVALDDELRRLASVWDDGSGLPRLAAGLADGRRLDEITIYLAGDAAVAEAALAPAG
jgi:hypothetical protein